MLLIVVLAPCGLAAQQQSQLTAALRLAQDGRIDSARATLKRMEQSTVPTDTLCPGILYSSALISPTAEEVRQRRQRVIVEYPFSRWAEPSMIALAQLDYATAIRPGQGGHSRIPHRSRDLVALSRGRPVGRARRLRRQRLERRMPVGTRRPGPVGDDASTRAELVALGRRCTAAATVPSRRPLLPHRHHRQRGLQRCRRHHPPRPTRSCDPGSRRPRTRIASRSSQPTRRRQRTRCSTGPGRPGSRVSS